MNRIDINCERHPNNRASVLKAVLGELPEMADQESKMELQKVQEVQKKFADLKRSAKLVEQKSKAVQSVVLPYQYLSNLKGKGLRSKLMDVSEFPFEVRF